MKIALSIGNGSSTKPIFTYYSAAVVPAEVTLQMASAVRELLGPDKCTLMYYSTREQFARSAVRNRDDIAIRFTCSESVNYPSHFKIYYFAEGEDIETRRLRLSIKESVQKRTQLQVYSTPSSTPSLFYLQRHGVTALEINLGSLCFAEDCYWITQRLTTTAGAITYGIEQYLDQLAFAQYVGYKERPLAPSEMITEGGEPNAKERVS